MSLKADATVVMLSLETGDATSAHWLDAAEQYCFCTGDATSAFSNSLIKIINTTHAFQSWRYCSVPW